MGTRHLIAVAVDGRLRVAQYGQFDGYPGGQGADLLDILRAADVDVLRSKARATRFLADDGVAALGDDWLNTHPQLSRSRGAKIVADLLAAQDGLELVDASNFAGDSLFCEYGYVVDLDRSVLEAYRGFVHKPHTGQRFSEAKTEPHPRPGAVYYPIEFVAEWPLSALPTVEEMEKAYEAHDKRREESEP